MGFLSKAKEKTKQENAGQVSKLNEEKPQASQQQDAQTVAESEQSQGPIHKTFVIDHTHKEEGPLREKIATSYDKVLYHQENKETSDIIEDSHKIMHTETATTIVTIMDKLLEIIQEKKKIGIKTLAKTFHTPLPLIEYWISILEKHHFVKLHYPLNIFSDIQVLALDTKEEKKTLNLPEKRELLESYTVSSDHVVARINIWGTATKDIPIYQIIIPQIGQGTQALLQEIVNKISEEFTVELEELTDKKKKQAMITRFFEFTKNLLMKKLPKVNEAFVEVLAGTLLHQMYGLGEMEILMADNWIEEIAINGSQSPVSIYHKKYKWVKTTLHLETEEEIYNFASRIGRNVGREINSLHPIMDAHLTTGDRVAATLFPISTAGNTITIRRFSRNPWTVISLIDPTINTLSPEVAALLWLAMQYELNIIVAGGTASGKTSMLNSLASLIPPKQRVISIEDTREIFLPKALHWNWVPMTTRKANPEGKGEITMLDLMVASLRMRPDRIIVGEVRRKEQAEAMFETMHTGHSVYATMHADTVEQVQRRLLEPPIAIPKTELGALHLIVVQYRDRRKGSRRTLEVAEVLSADTDDNSVELNYLYRWRPRNDTFEKINESIRIVQELNLHTGMTNEEIKQDLKEKEMILKWLLEHNIKQVDDVGKITKIYYATPEVIVEAAKNNEDPRKYF